MAAISAAISRLLARTTVGLLVGLIASSDAGAWNYPTPTPKPTNSPKPTGTPVYSTPTPKPTNSPKPTGTPVYATPTPKPTNSPKPTGTPVYATPTPKPTNSPKPTGTPVYATPTPKPTNSPKPTGTPVSTPTPTPAATATARPTGTPTATPKPTGTPTPRPTGTAIVPPTPASTGTPVDVCHHNCPDKIRFSKFDQLTVRSAFPIGAFIPDDADLEITLENANGIVYSATLLPGDLSRRGKSLIFLDRNAKKGTGFRDGLSKVKIQEVPNGLGMRVTIEAYGDLKDATDPTMTLTLRVGEHENSITDTWQQTNFGWFRFHN
jgi:hypothetical protein